MIKSIVLSIILMFGALCLNVFGQSAAQPFQVTVSGKGDQSIILIPGFASSGDVWDSTKPALEKKFTCYTLTMAGFAGVPAQPEASFQNWVKGIADYIQQNKITKPIVIGHSMGGGMAMALAANYPNLVSKIIVVDALPCLAALQNPSFKSNPQNDCSAMVAKFTFMPDDQFYQMQKQSIPQLVADTSKHELVVGWSVKSDRATCAQMYCDFSNTDLRETIGNIQCPSLILLESYFVNFKPGISDQYKNLKTANLQYANKGLHFIMYDDKEWFDGQVNNFISQ